MSFIAAVLILNLDTADAFIAFANLLNKPCQRGIFTLYSKSFPLDLACRVWDVFCRDGEEFLFRTALGVLRLYQDVLTAMDFIHMAQFLTRLPDLIPPEQLFQHIAAVHMTSRNRKWAQVLQTLTEQKKSGARLSGAEALS
ncbi:hypothetical protein CRENBAI_024972 [Crenichthys baileyi]|uniref:Rab-GAP TBC domain-containing protein n=1 Tax=Crenichthys baileyi TaxID=28760 RepID=A0AAV9SGG0_9TELE